MVRLWGIVVLGFLCAGLASFGSGADASPVAGAWQGKVRVCWFCHAPFNAARAPWPSTLRLMTQPTILAAIETGKMQMQAADLSHEQRVALATYLGATEASLDSRQADACGKDGYIRAYDAANGRLLWEFNTARTFPTVNGVGGHGGSINYAGAVVAGGMVYVTSGYSTNAGMPGNGLLAFSVDGK